MSTFTNNEILILSVLSTPLYEDQIIKAVKKEHDIDISLSSLFPTLERFVALGFVGVRYHMTRAGHELIIEKGLEIIHNMDAILEKYRGRP